MVRAIDKLIGASIERRTLANFDYKAAPVTPQRKGPDRTQRHQKQRSKPAHEPKRQVRKEAFAWLSTQEAKAAGRPNLGGVVR